MGPSSKPLNSDDDLKKFLEKPETVVVSYGSEDGAFLKVADALRETVNFGHFKDAKDKKGVYLHR